MKVLGSFSIVWAVIVCALVSMPHPIARGAVEEDTSRDQLLFCIGGRTLNRIAGYKGYPAGIGT